MDASRELTKMKIVNSFRRIHVTTSYNVIM
jgi:hypothetical protein